MTLRILDHLTFLAQYVDTSSNFSIFSTPKTGSEYKIPLNRHALTVEIDSFAFLERLISRLKQTNQEVALYANGKTLYIFSNADLRFGLPVWYLESSVSKTDLYFLLDKYEQVKDLELAYLLTVKELERKNLLPLKILVQGSKFYIVEFEAITRRTRELMQISLLLHEGLDCYSPDIKNVEAFKDTFLFRKEDFLKDFCCLQIKRVQPLSTTQIYAYSALSNRFRISEVSADILLQNFQEV